MSDWVAAQSRTMARWVGSKVDMTITNLVSQVADGLVLVKLINRINAEAGTSPYVLSPVHPRPTFRLHRLENVADLLQFCRLELKINTAAFSAENVVDGDAKLILGLIWTLFVFSTALLMLTSNDARSMAEIKTILLAWLNQVCRRRVLPEISNFNSDWSFQRLRRPDLVFACIMDSYVPGLVDFDRLLHGKILANMAQVCRVAESELEIPLLASVEDFNVLVPDEKCVLFYVLQWYLRFEGEGLDGLPLSGLALSGLALDQALDPYGSKLDSTSPRDSAAQFLTLVLRAVKIRNKYDTLALRLVNHANHAKTALARLETRLSAQNVDLSAELDLYCADFSDLSDPSGANSSEPQDFLTQLSSRENLGCITAAVLGLRFMIADYDQFRRSTKPALFYHDLPELEALLKTVQVELKLCGLVSGYIPSKQLSLTAICDRLAQLDQLDRQIGTRFGGYVDELRRSKLRSLDNVVDFMHDRIGLAEPGVSAVLKLFIDGIDMLTVFKAELDCFAETLLRNHTTADLRAILQALESLEFPDTPETPDKSAFHHFSDLVLAETNRKNLSSLDLREFLKRSLGPAGSARLDMTLLFRVIPTRRLLVRSESDALMLYASDDSDDLGAVFELAQRNLEQKLSGNYNILYDLDSFVTKLDNGFRV